MTITESALATAVTRLRAAGCVFAEDEAAVLRSVAGDDDALADLVSRRAQGEPLEQVAGYADFCGLHVRLRKGVFVPRVRSELLVRVAVAEQPDVLVDLCCGSGALGIAVKSQKPDVDLYAADIDPVAVECARDNGVLHAYQGDLYSPLPAALRHRVDVILANVPYVATAHIPLLPSEARDHEPRAALDGGGDGLDVFRRVAEDAASWLAPDGVLLSEITEAQEQPARQALAERGLDGDVIYDDDLEARVIRARKRE
ncbi:N5-glutamine S-adenosyl-L-methionine-dependent methyltransferase [Paractinoplanes deccanensis]|uniref:peptide chain release factor N(5)-glutamine methyltransferase n=1 Tax=Paractinoplanes deccanensis TaxID=113561 RepID=A0ABQ3Y654_9ACTN|nr:putative protein N(5)-glutamine methyltransferase [Actinoplanes deccanensis]GID75471.1 N5-glutamine S-adenosyl-L-methionine-dependent methyltransferase [Actinoplanes deccanensis]